MPAKNAIKEYEAGGYYHLYNRGVEKRIIFEDKRDCKTFLSYLKFYLCPTDTQMSLEKISPSRIPKNYDGEITLLAYCLMPNHFHLFVKQNSEHGIDSFMRSFMTKYVRYFNTRHERVGPLFQGIYKAVRVISQSQFIYLSKYIHRNPLDLNYIKDDPCRLAQYKYSSYGNYLGRFSQPWVKVGEVLANFSPSGGNSYQVFVEGDDAECLAKIDDLVICLE